MLVYGFYFSFSPRHTRVWDQNLGGLNAYFLCEGQDPH